VADLEIYMVIDGSGSMIDSKKDVVKGVNALIDEQKDDAKATGDDILFTLTSFDHNVKEVYSAEDISIVSHVSETDTFLGGSTALLDAIGKTIATVPDNNTKKLVVVYTDGQEHCSREFTRDQIKKMIEDYEATGMWQFVYMSAELADFAQPQSMGFSAGSTVTGTTRGTTAAHFSTISTATKNYRNTGAAATQDWFSANADDLAVASIGGTVGSDVDSKLVNPTKTGKVPVAPKDDDDES
jgi:uncharacterized protein YegL